MATRLTALLLACVLAPSTLAAQAGRGQVYAGVITESGVQKTEDQLKAEIAAEPRSMRPRVELSQLYQRANRIDDADRVLREALPLFPNAAMVFSVLVGLHMAANNFEKVLQIAEEWRQAQPDSARPFVAVADAHLGHARLLKAQRSEAQQHLDLAARAIEDAKSVAAQDPGVVTLGRQRVLRMRVELETDPTERAKLMQELDELMRQSPMGSFTGVPAGGSAQLSWESSSASPRAPGGAVRVGGNIRPPVKIKDVRPEYPPTARESRAQGVVIVELTIGADGKVANARVLRSIPLLDQAALDAVHQWEFEPTLLNGQPVPVILTAPVSFSLM